MKPRENVQPLRSAEEIEEFRQAFDRGLKVEREVIKRDGK